MIRKRAIVAAVILGTFVSAGSEAIAAPFLLQIFTGPRDITLVNWFGDVTGILTGIFAFLYYQSRMPK